MLSYSNRNKSKLLGRLLLLLDFFQLFCKNLNHTENFLIVGNAILVKVRRPTAELE